MISNERLNEELEIYKLIRKMSTSKLTKEEIAILTLYNATDIKVALVAYATSICNISNANSLVMVRKNKKKEFNKW